MPDPQTPNLGLYTPARGADVGVWDTPVNANWNVLDNAFGAVTSVPITNTPITLSTAQAQSSTIVFTGAQTGNLSITFPPIGKAYNLMNIATNAAAWIVALQVGGNQLALPPNQMVSMFNDGTKFHFLTLPPVGTYVDIAARTPPTWMIYALGACVPPFINCDGSAFSAVSYPVLAYFLGTTNVPDLRGRARYTMNQGTARLTAIDGDSMLSAGGANSIAQGNLPNVAFTSTLGVNDPGHFHSGTTAVESNGHDHNFSVTVNGNTSTDGNHTHSVTAMQQQNTGTVGGSNFLGSNVGITTSTNGDHSHSVSATGGGTTGTINQTHVHSLTTAGAATGISLTGGIFSGGSGTPYISPSFVAGITLVRAG